MEPDRFITILEPRETGRNQAGEPVVETIRHRVWARRVDRGGNERIAVDVFIAESSTRWTIRSMALSVRPQAKWRLCDEFGNDHEILHVAEAVIPGAQTRGGTLWLYSERRA